MNAVFDGGHPAAPDDEAQAARYAPLPKNKRKGIGLCLSGGGFRATLFHLGALRRLNELGVLSRGDFRTVASVSGGSITSAQLAEAFTHIVLTPGQAIPREVWDRDVQAPLRAFTTQDVRTGPFFRRLLPWNVWRTETTVEALALRYEKDLTRLRLSALPSRPEFLFLATDMAYGVSWVFSRGWMGDYKVGYMPPPSDFPVARAVAASACFPPLFGPLRLRLDPGELKGGSAPQGDERSPVPLGLPAHRRRRLRQHGAGAGLEEPCGGARVGRGRPLHEPERPGPALARAALPGDPGAPGARPPQALARGGPFRRRSRRGVFRRGQLALEVRAGLRGLLEGAGPRRDRRDPHRSGRVHGCGSGRPREPRLPGGRRRLAPARALRSSRTSCRRRRFRIRTGSRPRARSRRSAGS